MMCVNTSCHLKENLFIDLAKTFADVQNGGVLDEFVSVINKVAKNTIFLYVIFIANGKRCFILALT